MTGEELGNASPKYNYKKKRQLGATRDLGEKSVKSYIDFMNPTYAEYDEDSPEPR